MSGPSDIHTLEALAAAGRLTSSIYYDGLAYLTKTKPTIILGLTQFGRPKPIVGIIGRTAKFQSIGRRKPHDATFMIDVPENSVLAIEIDPATSIHSPVGSIVSRALQQQRTRGVLLSGRLRDATSIPRTRPIWATGTTVCGAYGHLLETGVDGPVSLLGTTVHPGQLIFADGCGIVVGHVLSQQEQRIVARFVDADEYAMRLVVRQRINSNDAKDSALQHFGLAQ